MGWERSGDLPKLTLVVRADPSQCEHQRVYNEWVCPFHRIPLGCWIQTLIRLSLLTTFLKSHSRRIQSWGSSIQGGPCFKIQQRSDMEMENGSEGGDKAASRPLNQAVEGITVMITVQGTPQEEQVWGTVGRMNLKVRSVGTSRHSDVLPSNWRVMWTPSVHGELPARRCSKGTAVTGSPREDTGEKNTNSKPTSILPEGAGRGRRSHHLQREDGGERWHKRRISQLEPPL